MVRFIAGGPLTTLYCWLTRYCRFTGELWSFTILKTIWNRRPGANMNQSRRTTLIFFATTAFSGVVKAAVSVPSSIRIIIPWPPGSGGDIAGRLVAQKLGEELHANVYVE